MKTQDVSNLKLKNSKNDCLLKVELKEFHTDNSRVNSRASSRKSNRYQSTEIDYLESYRNLSKQNQIKRNQVELID